MFGFHFGNRQRACGDSELPPATVRAAREMLIEHAPESLWSEIEASLNARPTDLARTKARWMWLTAAALAAGLAITAVVVAIAHHPKARWSVRLERAGAGIPATLAVGDWLITDPHTTARVEVGQIGEVDVEPNSRVRLLRARPADNRLSLARGEINARIWAPPRLFFVETPSAVAVDLGCAYKLSVDQHGAGLLRVTMGWVMLQEHGRESMVPAGAVCRMRPGIGPGTPYFENASSAFAQALARFDFNHDSGALATVLAQARPRDAFTLVHLLERVDPRERPVIFNHAVALAPLPEGVTRAGALAGNRGMLDRWIDNLAWAW